MGLKNVFSRAKKVAEGYVAPVDPVAAAHRQAVAAALEDSEQTGLLQQDPDAWMHSIDEADLMLEHLFEIAENNDWFDIDEEEQNIQLICPGP